MPILAIVLILVFLVNTAVNLWVAKEYKKLEGARSALRDKLVSVSQPQPISDLFILRKKDWHELRGLIDMQVERGRSLDSKNFQSNGRRYVFKIVK